MVQNMEIHFTSGHGCW